jgi:hypothetical protein
MVVRSISRPELDVVRRLDTDDPQGGPFDGAPDRFVLGGPALHRPLRPRQLREEAGS